MIVTPSLTTHTHSGISSPLDVLMLNTKRSKIISIYRVQSVGYMVTNSEGCHVPLMSILMPTTHQSQDYTEKEITGQRRRVTRVILIRLHVYCVF